MMSKESLTSAGRRCARWREAARGEEFFVAFDCAPSRAWVERGDDAERPEARAIRFQAACADESDRRKPCARSVSVS